MTQHKHIHTQSTTTRHAHTYIYIYTIYTYKHYTHMHNNTITAPHRTTQHSATPHNWLNITQPTTTQQDKHASTTRDTHTHTHTQTLRTHQDTSTQARKHNHVHKNKNTNIIPARRFWVPNFGNTQPRPSAPVPLGKHVDPRVPAGTSASASAGASGRDQNGFLRCPTPR